MNIYLIVILAVLTGSYILDLIVELLNLSAIKTTLPEEFEGWYDSAKYAKAQNYLKDNTRFSLIHSTVFTSLIIFLILSGAFNVIDRLARAPQMGAVWTGLIFAGIIFLGSQIAELPFSIYHTFVIEKKYGFNRTTLKTFVLDILKSWVLTAIIGGIAFAGIIWFFLKAGSLAWVWCWLGLSLFELFLTFIAPVVIMPLFNKFTPLEDGQLKEAVQNYAASQNFKMEGVFKMDGSRRSSKSNAFFTGFGRHRRIALFDTLIEKHSVNELVSVLAHEIGHYKKGHILKRLLISVFTTGLMFFILSFFINNPGLFSAFKVEELSIYASLFFFGFLYTPISMVLSILSSILSRKHEYEADRFAVTTFKQGKEDFINALKKLSVDNLSNLTPHPLKVFLSYSHPPVLKRIRAIKSLSTS